MPKVPKVLNRRSILKGVSGLAALSLAPQVLATTSKQPIVWRDMSQEELDTAYSQSHWASNMKEVSARYGKNSDVARERLGEPRNFSYGDSADETLDYYPARVSSAPVHISVHGGAWFTGNARDHGFLAETFVNAGAHFIAINYSSVKDTDGLLMPLADQVRRAVAWVHRNAQQLELDPEKIFLSGHSAGAHLAAVAMTTNWPDEFKLPPDIVKGGLFCSGIFDLEPVSLSVRREYVQFDHKTIHMLSPQRHLESMGSPVIVAYGTLESPEFQRQSRDFATEARRQGNPVDVLVAENYNHFEIIETLANPYGLLGFAALRQMNLN